MDHERMDEITRRHFFKKSATGLGTVALASLLNDNLFAADSIPGAANPLTPKASHFAPQAKSIIYPSHGGSPFSIRAV